MNRVFIDAAEIVDSRIEILGGDAGHLLRVLRLGVGDPIELCDGKGMDYPARIVDVYGDRLIVELGKGRLSRSEPKTRVYPRALRWKWPFKNVWN